MRAVTEQQHLVYTWLLNGFLGIIKACTVFLLLLLGVLIVSQSSVAPVSTRLLSTYALEYANQKIKPYRQYFPKPYMINNTAEEETR